jgi:hypothetical protein
MPDIQQAAGVLSSLDEIDRAAAGHGIISAELSNGVLRRIPLVFNVNGTCVPALAIEMLRIAIGAPSLRLNVSGSSVHEISVGDFVAPTEKDGAVHIYYSHRDPRRYVSAVDVIKGRIDPLGLKQKLVLIGVTGEPMPAVEIQAQLLENLYDKALLLRTVGAPTVELAMTLLVGTAMLWLFFRASALTGIVVAAGTIATLLATSYLAFRTLNLLLDVSLIIGIVLALVVQQSLTLLQRAKRQSQLIRAAADHSAHGRSDNKSPQEPKQEAAKEQGQRNNSSGSK